MPLGDWIRILDTRNYIILSTRIAIKAGSSPQPSGALEPGCLFRLGEYTHTHTRTHKHKTITAERAHGSPLQSGGALSAVVALH